MLSFFVQLGWLEKFVHTVRLFGVLATTAFYFFIHVTIVSVTTCYMERKAVASSVSLLFNVEQR